WINCEFLRRVFDTLGSTSTIVSIWQKPKARHRYGITCHEATLPSSPPSMGTSTRRWDTSTHPATSRRFVISNLGVLEKIQSEGLFPSSVAGGHHQRGSCCRTSSLGGQPATAN